MNTVILRGNLGADPEVKHVGAKSTAVASFNIAVSEYKGKDQNGEAKYATFWVKVVCWGWLAENAQKNLQKGDAIVVQGRLSIRSWEDKDGAKRYATEIVADQVSKLQKSARAANANASNSEPLFEEDDGGFGDPGDTPY